MAGCSGARHIVAINNDREANIFKDASYGVVGDWQAVIPSFMETRQRPSGLLNLMPITCYTLMCRFAASRVRLMAAILQIQGGMAIHGS